MLLAFGMVCALLEAQKSGKGQVVDAAMVDGTASLMAMFYSMAAIGAFSEIRGTNMLDGGAHFYDTYETRDEKYICLGSIEPQFYAELVEKAGLDGEKYSLQMDQESWPQLTEDLKNVFRSKTRAEWCDIMEGSDVCFAPVLSIFEAPAHPHNVARKSYLEVDGIMQQAPAPRFSRTEAVISGGARIPGQDTLAVLKDYGFDQTEIERLGASGAIQL